MAELMNAPWPVLSKYILIAVPLFVIMGHFAFHAGVSRKAYDLGRAWLSRFPGGLGMATIAGCAGFAATSGSSVATAATMGRVAIPEMEQSGYASSFAAGTVAAGGLLGIMIPPSVPLVLYAVLTDTSVGAMLVAGIIPGLLSAIIFVFGIAVMVKRNPSLAPGRFSVPWKERFDALKGGWGIVVLFGVVIGGMFAGFFTPTEAAAAGAFVALLMLLATRSKVRVKLFDSLTETVRTVGMIFIIVLCASFYAEFINVARLPTTLAESAVSLPVPPLVVVALCLALYIPLGMFLDPISILLITLPITFPVVGALGFSAIWYGVLVVKLIEISLITPPVGLNVYTLAGIAKHIPLEKIFRGVTWFIAWELVSTALLFAFPFISTWLPSLIYTSAR